MILVTGAGGLIGGESVEHFSRLGERVIGIDNNSRGVFFGQEGDVRWNLDRLTNKYPNFENYQIDIRDFDSVRQLIKQAQPDVIIHTAAQPSHDRATTFPLTDFEVNAFGTLNLLEATRLESPESVFIHLSTNKVYGDGPNRLELNETETRYEFASLEFKNGIDENFSIDHSLHSLFGASKLSADIYAQEYGKYYGLKVGIFRGGCLTGPYHSGVQLHGFLSYLISCHVLQKPYTVFGYKGKQVRDQIHCEDVLSAFELFAENPKCGEVYNLGGGKSNSASIVEISKQISNITQRPLNFGYQETPRRGDHICYYSNMSKFESDYNNFKIKKSLDIIIEEMTEVSLDLSKGRKATFLL